MKKKDIQELPTKTIDELKKLLADLRKEVFSSELELSMKKVTNTGDLKERKRDIARILTVLGNQEFTESKTKSDITEKEVASQTK